MRPHTNSYRWRAVIAAITGACMVVLLSSPAGAGQPRGFGRTTGPSEQQALLEASGASGAQFLSEAQALAQQLGISLHSQPIDTKDVGDVAAQMRHSLAGLAQLITAGSYVAGMGFAVAAIAKFKAHKDNPTQVPLSGPIVMLFVAAALIFAPAVFLSVGGTLYDPTKMTPSIEGIDMLKVITPVLQRAKSEGLTKETARGPLLPANATAEIRTALEARGLSGQTLGLITQLAELTAQGIVAGART
jgi:hypothetical protein